MGYVSVVLMLLAACGRIGFDENVTPDVSEQSRATFAVGAKFACAIRSGDVWCWGAGEEGQFGDGSRTSPVLTPIRVPAIPEATQISVAMYHACVVTVDATVWCWGGDEVHRLGNAPGGPPTDPALVALPGRAVEVSVAHDHGCASLESGAVWCWGRDLHGQLGRGVAGTDMNGYAPGAVIGVSDAIHVSVADDSSCALRRGGEVVCWGENGLGMIDATSADVVTPRAVAGLDGATSITVGGDHICALIDGRVGCRGRGGDGQLGSGMFENSMVVVFTTLADFVTVEAGFTHTCAVRSSGEAMCWGMNDDGVLGDGTLDPRPVPTMVANLDDAVSIVTDDRATCVARADTRITCWGWGARGLLGDGRKAELRARNVPTISGITSLAAGPAHTCASAGLEVQCWGSNRFGQLGFGATSGVMATPQTVNFAWPADIATLVAGGSHTCALLDDNSVYCWGSNSIGQIGDGSLVDRPSPTLVTLPATSRLVAGLDFTCALGTDMAVRCWGHNSEGQIGDGTTTTRAAPVMVATGVAELAAGMFHACVRIGGQVSCWGSNGTGELGDGSTALFRPTAGVVPGLTASNIMSGGRSSCAKTVGGTVACWGINDSGVLDADDGVYVQPTPITSNQPELFAIGGGTGCIGTNCWGQNSTGQAGGGTFGNYDAPTMVADLPIEAGVSEYAMSSTHTCTIVVPVGRTVWCWGENASGEIGVGSVTTAMFPATTVAFP